MSAITDKSGLKWEFFKGQGPGGQHRNKVETAVRLTHVATGIVVTAQERRSRLRNMETALVRLQEKIEQLNKKPKPRRPTKPTKASRQRRLESKKSISRKKSLRGKVTSWS